MEFVCQSVLDTSESLLRRTLWDQEMKILSKYGHSILLYVSRTMVSCWYWLISWWTISRIWCRYLFLFCCKLLEINIVIFLIYSYLLYSTSLEWRLMTPTLPLGDVRDSIYFIVHDPTITIDSLGFTVLRHLCRNMEQTYTLHGAKRSARCEAYCMSVRYQIESSQVLSHCRHTVLMSCHSKHPPSILLHTCNTNLMCPHAQV